MRDEDKNFGDSLVLDFRIDDVTSKRSINYVSSGVSIQFFEGHT